MYYVQNESVGAPKYQLCREPNRQFMLESRALIKSGINEHLNMRQIFGNLHLWSIWRIQIPQSRVWLRFDVMYKLSVWFVHYKCQMEGSCSPVILLAALTMFPYQWEVKDWSYYWAVGYRRYVSVYVKIKCSLFWPFTHFAIVFHNFQFVIIADVALCDFFSSCFFVCFFFVCLFCLLTIVW